MAYIVARVQAVLGSDISNPFSWVFTYNTTELIPNSSSLDGWADSFVGTVLEGAAGVAGCLQSTMQITQLEVTAPYQPTALHLRAVAIDGLRSGTVQPGFVAWGFKSLRSVGGIRSGFKRFGAISETDTAGNVPTSGMATVLDNVASTLSLDLDYAGAGGTELSFPIIVKRIKYTTPGGSDAYRLPSGLDTFESAPATNWIFQKITTQNSRKD